MTPEPFEMEKKTKESFDGTYCINGDLAEIFSEQNDLKISYFRSNDENDPY